MVGEKCSGDILVQEPRCEVVGWQKYESRQLALTSFLKRGLAKRKKMKAPSSEKVTKTENAEAENPGQKIVPRSALKKKKRMKTRQAPLKRAFLDVF